MRLLAIATLAVLFLTGTACSSKEAAPPPRAEEPSPTSPEIADAMSSRLGAGLARFEFPADHRLPVAVDLGELADTTGRPIERLVIERALQHALQDSGKLVVAARGERARYEVRPAVEAVKDKKDVAFTIALARRSDGKLVLELKGSVHAK